MVQQLKAAIPDCKSIKNQDALDWTEFDNIISTIEDDEKHPYITEVDIMMNGKAIGADIWDILETLRHGDFIEFGQKLGNTLYFASQDDKDIYIY